MNKIVRKGIVAKINFGPIVGELYEKFGICSNEKDAFVLNKDAIKKFSVLYRAPRTEEAVEFQPGVGSKFYGQYRDKGSISSIPSASIVAVYKFKKVVEVDRFEEFLKQITNPYKRVKNIIYATVDIVANSSHGRDNVNALVTDSALCYKSILQDTDIKMSFEEVADIDVIKLCTEINMDFEVQIVDENYNCLHSFGKTCVLLEDIFWQPTHDQKIHNKLKDNISINYNQAIDGLQVLLPSLYEAVINSYDTKKIADTMNILGIKLTSHEDFVHQSTTVGVNEPNKDNEFDFDDLM